MRCLVVPAGLENVGEGDDVRLDVVMWVRQAVADPRLRSEVDHAAEAVDCKGGIDGGLVDEIGADKCKISGTGSACPFEQHQSRFLQGRIVVVVDNIEADHVVAPRDQLPRGVEADETSGTGNEGLHMADSPNSR